MRHLRVPAGKVYELQFGPDGKSLCLVVKEALLEAPAVPDMELFQHAYRLDIPSGEVTGTWPFLGSEVAVFTPDLSALYYSISVAVCGRELDVRSTRLGSGAKESCYTTSAVYPSSFAFSPNGHILAIGGVHYWQGDGLEYVHRLDVWHKTELDPIRTDVKCLAFSPDGRKLATGSFVKQVDHSAGMRIWEGKRLTEEFGPSANHLAWSSDGRLAWGAAQQLNVVRPGTGEPVRSWCGTSPGLSALSFSPDNRLLLTGTDNGLCSLHNSAEGETHAIMDWAIGPIHSVAFSPDGLTCAAGGDKGQVVVWDVDE